MRALRPSLRHALATVILVSSLGATLSACDSGPKAGEEEKYYGPKLLEGEHSSRDVAMKKLSELKKPASLPFLYDALKGQDAEIRPEAAQLIGLIGDDKSIEPLVNAIDWSAGAGGSKEQKAATNTNERIAKALAKLAKGDDKRAVDALKKLAANTDQNVQLAAIVALGDLKAHDAVGDLMEIADGHPNNFMVKSACESLGKIGDPKSVPSLIRLMFFERTGVSFYREASYALFQVGAPAVPALIDLYEGKAKNLDELHVDPNLQKTKAVVVMGDLGDPSTFKYVEAAAGNTGEDTASALLRIEGMRAAGRLGLEKVVPSMLKRFDNPDISQSEHDLATLTQLGKKQIAAELATLVGSDGFLKNCKKKFTEDQCKFSEAQIRKPRIIALTRLGAGPELAAVEKMITAEKNEKVKAALEEAKPRLVVGKDCAGKGVACFKSHLKDKEAPARERAAYELVWTNTDEARDALLDALHDDDNEVRYAAIIGVGRRLPQDKKLADVLQKQLDEEKGKTQFIRVNEDLKRLEIRVRRGA